MIFYTTLNEIEKIVKNLGLKIDQVDNLTYKIYAPIPEQFMHHIFVGSDRRKDFGLEICEFSTSGYFIWNECIKFLDGIKTSTNHHWTSWVRPLFLIRVKYRLTKAKNICDNMSLMWKQSIMKENLDKMERDFI